MKKYHALISSLQMEDSIKVMDQELLSHSSLFVKCPVMDLGWRETHGNVKSHGLNMSCG